MSVITRVTKAPVRVRGVKPAAAVQQLLGFSIDSPRADGASETYAVRISGWVLARDHAVSTVEVLHEGRSVRAVKVDLPRVDLARLHPDVPHAATCGFDTRVGLLGLPRQCELTLEAVLAEGHRVELAQVSVDRDPLETGFEPVMQPLMVTSLFRMGTTRLMRLLGSHPQILVHAIHPYEVRMACYWMHALKVLSEPANFDESCHPDYFRATTAWLGNNPFYCNPIIDEPAIEGWIGRSCVERLAGFCQDSCEAFYRQVANVQSEDRPRYFAEKHTAGPHAWILWELYPRAREIFLVRDFRDMVCSILAFNEKRGYLSFGRELVESDGRMVEELGGRVDQLLRAWRSRAPVARLVRYEDLVTEPARILGKLFEYLEVDASEHAVREVLRAADRETPEVQQHRTAASARESIGRWRRELDPELSEICLDRMGEALETFGYEPVPGR